MDVAAECAKLMALFMDVHRTGKLPEDVSADPSPESRLAVAELIDVDADAGSLMAPDKDKDARELLHGVQQQLHVHMGQPANKDVAARRKHNKAARKARRTTRKASK